MPSRGSPTDLLAWLAGPCTAASSKRAISTTSEKFPWPRSRKARQWARQIWLKFAMARGQLSTLILHLCTSCSSSSSPLPDSSLLVRGTSIRACPLQGRNDHASVLANLRPRTCFLLGQFDALAAQCFFPWSCVPAGVRQMVTNRVRGGVSAPCLASELQVRVCSVSAAIDECDPRSLSMPGDQHG